MLAQYMDADFNHPFSQFIYRITVVPIRLLRVIIPKIGGSDLLTPFVLVYSVVALEQYLRLLGSNIDAGFAAIIFLSATEVVSLVISVLVVAVLARVVVSWIPKWRFTPFSVLLYGFTEPIMAPVRRAIPSFGGLDFSPIVVLLGLELIEYFGIGLIETIANRLFDF